MKLSNLASTQRINCTERENMPTNLPLWCQNRANRTLRLIKLTRNTGNKDENGSRKTMYCFNRVRNAENILFLHKMSALMQDLENDQIGHYQQTNIKIYDPTTHEHLEQHFIDGHMDQLLKYNNNHEKPIQEKLERIRMQLKEENKDENEDENENDIEMISNDEPDPVIAEIRERIDAKASHDLHKDAIEKETQLLKDIIKSRNTLAKAIYCKHTTITDYGDSADVLNDDQLNDKILDEISKPLKQRRIKIEDKWYHVNSVIKKEKCGKKYRIKALANQNCVRAKMFIPKGTVIGMYSNTCLRTQQYNKLHPHPANKAQHGAYAFGCVLNCFSEKEMLDVLEESHSNTSAKTIKRLMKKEVNVMKKIDCDPNKTRLNEWTTTIIADPHCGPKKDLKNVMLAMNDCRDNIHSKTRSQADLDRENVNFWKIQVNFFPFVFAATSKDVQEGDELCPFYSSEYGQAMIGEPFYNEMIDYVNDVLSDLTQN